MTDAVNWELSNEREIMSTEIKEKVTITPKREGEVSIDWEHGDTYLLGDANPAYGLIARGLALASDEDALPEESAEPRYDWIDFEPDDADNVPDKYILTIREDEEELAVIVHRTLGDTFPLNGRLADSKRAAAQRIVDTLNKADSV